MVNRKVSPNLLQLHDDCLYIVFNKLNIKDQLRLAKTCTRFHNLIAELIWRPQFRDTCFITAQDPNGNEYLELFCYIAKYIEKFTIPKRVSEKQFQLFINCLNFQFPRLTEFRCLDWHLNDAQFCLLIKNCPELSIMHLCRTDISVRHIKKLRKLRKLTLEDCTLQTEQFLEWSKHLSLAHLNFIGTNCLPAVPFNEHSFAKLKFLRMTNIYGHFNEQLPYDVQDVKGFAQGLSENIGLRITTLNILQNRATGFINTLFENFDRFSALRKLRIASGVICEDLQKISQLSALKELEIYNACAIRPSSFLDLIAQSKYLERVDFLYADRMIGNDFSWLLDIIKVLRLENERSQLLLNIFHYDQAYFTDEAHHKKLQILQNARYTSQSLLSIKFERCLEELKCECGLDGFEMHLS